MAQDFEERREFVEGGDGNKRRGPGRRAEEPSHVSAHERLDKLESAVAENTMVSTKAASDSAESLKIVKQIRKDTAGFISMVKTGQRTGKITIKSVSWFRKAIIWLAPLIAGVVTIYYSLWGKH